MKTLTEFANMTIQRGLTQLKELTAASKTVEEIQAAITESFKLEGEKLKFFMNALNAVKEKTDRLKRVIVMTVAEGEKLPSGSSKIEEF